MRNRPGNTRGAVLHKWQKIAKWTVGLQICEQQMEILHPCVMHVDIVLKCSTNQEVKACSMDITPRRRSSDVFAWMKKPDGVGVPDVRMTVTLSEVVTSVVTAGTDLMVRSTGGQT